MGELRGGYIPGNLPPEEQARADQLLYEHVMGGRDSKPEGEQAGEPPADDEKTDR